MLVGGEHSMRTEETAKLDSGAAVGAGVGAGVGYINALVPPMITCSHMLQSFRGTRDRNRSSSRWFVVHIKPIARRACYGLKATHGLGVVMLGPGNL